MIIYIAGPYRGNATMAILRRCDAILLSPDWESSVGARAECAEAVRMGLTVLFDMEDVYGCPK